MKKLLVVIAVLISFSTFAQQKLIADYTLEMSAVMSSSIGEPVSVGTKIISVSGKKVRTDYSSARISQSTIRDNASNATVILRENEGSKFMRRLNGEEWKKENQRFDGIIFQSAAETKKILNYDCKKIVAHLKDGSVLTAYYTSSVSVIATENNFEFDKVPGLVLEYELQNAERTIRFTAKALDFDPVPASKFDIPISGYRIID